MIVTEVKPYNSKKYKIYIDGAYSFALYKGEMRRYHIEQGGELSPETYDEIMQEVLPRRGRSRALHLLEAMNRTEEQVRRKLLEGGYPPSVIEQVLDYVKEYRYVDDERYTSDYLRVRGRSKSVRQMKAELQNKGVSKAVIRQVLDEEPVDESAAIRRLIEKKNIDMEHASREQIHKLYQFLVRRGFAYSDIQRELDLYKNYNNSMDLLDNSMQ